VQVRTKKQKQMNSNPKIQQSLNLKKKALALLSKAIAKILLKFRLPRSEFISALDENLVLESKAQDPKASNVTIAIRTGIDRRFISKHLKGEAPQARPDKLAMILEDVRWTAHKYYNGTKLPKTGPFRTFQSICEQWASGTLTYRAILDELVRNGNIEDLGSKIELKQFKYNLNRNELDYSKLTATQINRVTDTLIFNSNKSLKSDMLIQRTVYSTQVSPEKCLEIHPKIENLIGKYYEEISQTILEFEEDVEVGTYPQYGISFLEFKTEEIEK
jgi:hypothetical protein